MKKYVLFSFILAIILILAACTETQPPGIGIIDMNRILEESRRGRQLNEELSRMGDQLEQTYQQQEKELSSADGEQELDNIYQQFLNNKQSMEEQLQQEIEQVLVEITEEKNLGVVLNNKNVHFGGEDITETLIESLDQEFYEGE